MIKLAQHFSPNTQSGHMKGRRSMLVMILRYSLVRPYHKFKSGLKLLPHQSVSGTTAWLWNPVTDNTWNEGRFHRPETIQ